MKIKEYDSFKDLNALLKSELSKNSYSAVIQCAAVSDYSPTKTFLNAKMSSDLKELVIKLKRNFKIVQKLKSYSKNKSLQVVAFKLTHGGSFSFKKTGKNVDFIVHNDLKGITQKKHEFKIYKLSKNDVDEKKLLEKGQTKKQMAEKLFKALML